MKKINILMLLLALVGIVGCSDKSPTILVNIQDLDTSKTRIILMHPTVRNLKTFLYLTDGKIFPVDSNYQIVGVFHNLGEYNYKQSVKFIENQHLEHIRLVEVKERLTPDSLYAINRCSPIFRELFRKSRGALFFGGPDIPPATYGKATHLLTEITDPYRHYLEISYLFHLLGGAQDTLFVPLLSENPSYAVLGICLGMQSMNVATGGTMIQDIPLELYGISHVEEVLALDNDMKHRNYNANLGIEKDLAPAAFHRIKYESGTLFDSLNGYNPSFPHVWSNHHQCIDVPGRGLVPIARSMDGRIIEAVVHSHFPNVIGVQFHPEAEAIYRTDEKIKLVTGQEEKLSYPEMYPGYEGELFHRSFWQYMAKRF